ncbi:hypothetical protein ACLM5J_07465 [Nocardioides sp. Bht2]|uniref:hypothetical protein n=1 Tax=Nocardioides sp. Bht2 TaxID=3392297 RepID=UPI0039B4D084
MRTGLTSLLLAALLGAGVTFGVSSWERDNSAARAEAIGNPDLGRTSDRVTHAVEGLADDGVYVAPDAYDLIDEAGEKLLIEAVAAAETDVRVVVWSRTRFAGTDSFELGEQLERAVATTLDQGLLLVWEGRTGTGSDTLIGEGYWINDTEFLGKPEITLPEMIAAADAEIEWRPRDPYGNGSDYYGGAWGGFAAGLLYGSGVLIVLALLWGLLRLAGVPRLPGSWGLSNTPGGTTKKGTRDGEA